ncbi:MAG: dTMP kinase [Tatlockia sp.]|nr:dTMP kinase [Tatlockia sp.]
MTKQGRFIVVEGLEGAGKSTAIKTIKDCLIDIAPELILTREPGGTQVGEAIRQIIKEKIEGETLDPRGELLLLYAARVQLVEDVIRPALKRGAWVLADRFELSSFAYQGWGRGLDIKMISQLSAFCLQSLKPDLIFYLDIEPEVGLLRVKKRGEMDRIEEETLSFFTRIRQGYQQMIQSMQNVISIDAGLAMETVQESILTKLKSFIADNAIT